MPRVHEYVKVAVGYTILGAWVFAGNWYTSGLTLTERARQIRDDNEDRAFRWITEPGPAKHSVPGVAVVRAPDLARCYHDSPRGASYAYTGATVTIPVRQYTVRGREIHWHLGDTNVPPLVIMELADGAPVPAGPTNHRVLWVTGVCGGRVEDGISREHSGYGFHIRITGCRAVIE